MDNRSSGGRTPDRLSRLKPWLIGVAAIVALAVTIVVVSALTAPKDAGFDRPAGLTDGQRAESLAKQAEQAARSGDTSEAAALARQAIATDPQNVVARKLLDTLEGGEESDVVPASEGTKATDPDKDPAPVAAKDPDAGFDKEVSDLSKLLPASIEGYRPGTLQADSRNAVMPFDPRYESRTLRTVLFSVHDQGSTAKARGFVDDVVKVAFPSGSPHEISLPGLSRPAYFGTQGRVATIGFYRGRYAFEVSVTGAEADAAALRSVTAELASKIPMQAP